MILSKKLITKPLISLRRCAGWTVPLLLANHRRQVFSRRGPNAIYHCYLIQSSERPRLKIYNTWLIPFNQLKCQDLVLLLESLRQMVFTIYTTNFTLTLISFYFPPENVVCLLNLLHILKCT